MGYEKEIEIAARTAEIAAEIAIQKRMIHEISPDFVDIDEVVGACKYALSAKKELDALLAEEDEGIDFTSLGDDIDFGEGE